MTIDPTARFSNRADAYVRARPGYPPYFLHVLRSECGLTDRSTVADVGSGTGLLAGKLVEAGARVLAVEPNAEMRAAAEVRLRRYPGFVSVDGRAEATTLEEGSVDLVTVAQAFHWFDHQACRVEFARVLRPGGCVALVWNERSKETGFNRAYADFIVERATAYQKVDHADVSDDALQRFFASSPMRVFSCANPQRLDRAGLEARVLSASYTPEVGHPAFEDTMAALGRLFDSYAVDGSVTLDMTCRFYIGTLEPHD